MYKGKIYWKEIQKFNLNFFIKWSYYISNREINVLNLRGFFIKNFLVLTDCDVFIILSLHQLLKGRRVSVGNRDLKETKVTRAYLGKPQDRQVMEPKVSRNKGNLNPK